jgi:ribonuclease-3
LDKFKKKLRLLQSSFGTYYTSCFDNSITAKEYIIKQYKSNNRRDMTLKSEIERRSRQQGCLHKYIPYNEPKRSREGPACTCSEEDFQKGVYHYCFAGEKAIPRCDPNSNNLDKLHHYFLKITESLKQSYPISSLIVYGETYEFEGFSLFLHQSYPKRFPATGLNDLYEDWKYELVDEDPPTHFTVYELEAFHDYLYGILLETFDLKRFPTSTSRENSCPTYHIYPRFVKVIGKQKRILSMYLVLNSLRHSLIPIEKGETDEKNIQGKLFIHPEMVNVTLFLFHHCFYILASKRNTCR